MNQEATLGPVRRSVEVAAPLEDAFRLFTDGIATWWPLGYYSVGGERATAVVFEPAVGGRIYEVMDDAGHADWGRVTAWEPPHRIVFSWHPGADPEVATEVEIRFAADGPDATRVELEHRHWERLGQRAADGRASYVPGWGEVLERYADVAGRAVDASAQAR